MYPPQGIQMQGVQPMLRLSRIVIDGDKDWQGKNINNVGTLQGNREVIATEEVLTRQVLKPTAAGGDALVIRDAADTIDRVVIKEDGSVHSGTIEVGI